MNTYAKLIAKEIKKKSSPMQDENRFNQETYDLQDT